MDMEQLYLVGLVVFCFIVFVGGIFWFKKDIPTIEQDKTIQETKDDEEDFTDFDFRNMVSQNLEKNRLAGSADGYNWTQTETEIEIRVPVETNFLTKNGTVNLKPSSLRVVIDKRIVIDGKLFASIQTDECCWVIDNAADNSKHVWITMFKSTPGIWDEVILSGPAIHSVNTSDAQSIKAAVSQLKKQQ